MENIELEYEKIFNNPPPYLYYRIEPEEWVKIIKKCIKTKRPAWHYLDTGDPNKRSGVI